MTPEQEIRAVAIQAAGAFCAPISPVLGQQIPNLEDVLFVADVFAGYIEGGWENALRVNATDEKKQQGDGEGPVQSGQVETVELREQASPAGEFEVKFDPDPFPTLPAGHDEQTATEPASSATSAPEPTEERTADVIPLAARGKVDPVQATARRKIEKVRHDRAMSFLNQARTAKAPEHKNRIKDEVELNELSGVMLEIDGRVQSLGSYLAKL